MGRRKSWVVPIQLTSAAMMLAWASWADARLQVRRLTRAGTALHVLLSGRSSAHLFVFSRNGSAFMGQGQGAPSINHDVVVVLMSSFAVRVHIPDH